MDGAHYFGVVTLDPTRWAAPIIIAHRGSRQLWPENTMFAFESALATGVEHLETDIHVSADGVVYCIHDHTVDRTTDGTGPVASLASDEVDRLDAGYHHRDDGGFPFRGQGVGVPTFSELALSFPDARLVVDLKEDSVVAPFADLVDHLGVGQRLIVGSFSDQRIARFRQLTGGRIATSTGSVTSRQWLVNSRVGRAGAPGPSALQLPVQRRGLRVVDHKLVDAAHNAGIQVHVWTINDPSEARDLFAMGVDGVVTDRPDLMMRLR